MRQYFIYQDVPCNYRMRPRYRGVWQNKDDVWCHAMGLVVNIFMRIVYMSVISVSYSSCFPYCLFWSHFLQILSSEVHVLIKIMVCVSLGVMTLWHRWDNIRLPYAFKMRQDYLSTSYLDQKYLPSERSETREIWIDPSNVCWDNPVSSLRHMVIFFSYLSPWKLIRMP